MPRRKLSDEERAARISELLGELRAKGFVPLESIVNPDTGEPAAPAVVAGRYFVNNRGEVADFNRSLRLLKLAAPKKRVGNSSTTLRLRYEDTCKLTRTHSSTLLKDLVGFAFLVDDLPGVPKRVEYIDKSLGEDLRDAVSNLRYVPAVCRGCGQAVTSKNRRTGDFR